MDSDEHLTGERFTLGVEEEFLLVDSETLELVPEAGSLLGTRSCDALDPSPEMHACVVEFDSPVCATASELFDVLSASREALATRAAGAGCGLLASGTHPFSVPNWQEVTPLERYRDVAHEYGWVARETVTCGMHVHVGFADRDLAVQVANVLRAYVPELLALSVNSPFWRAEDSGLASVRARLLGLYPRSGVPPLFEDWAAYETTMRRLAAAGTVVDHHDVWWAVRLHPTWGTIELRVCDVQLDALAASAIAALVQATCARIADELRLGVVVPDPSGVLIEENLWSAARHGADGPAIDLDSGTAVTMAERIERLIDLAAPYFERFGSSAFEPVLRGLVRAPGASRQRQTAIETGSLVAVVAATMEAQGSAAPHLA